MKIAGCSNINFDVTDTEVICNADVEIGDTMYILSTKCTLDPNDISNPDIAKKIAKCKMVRKIHEKTIKVIKAERKKVAERKKKFTEEYERVLHSNLWIVLHPEAKVLGEEVIHQSAQNAEYFRFYIEECDYADKMLEHEINTNKAIIDEQIQKILHYCSLLEEATASEHSVKKLDELFDESFVSLGGSDGKCHYLAEIVNRSPEQCFKTKRDSGGHPYINGFAICIMASDGPFIRDVYSKQKKWWDIFKCREEERIHIPLKHFYNKSE